MSEGYYGSDRKPRIGQWVRYTHGLSTELVGQIGEVRGVNRGMVHIAFLNGKEFGCWPHYLKTVTRRERAIAIASKALGVSNG